MSLAERVRSIRAENPGARWDLILPAVLGWEQNTLALVKLAALAGMLAIAAGIGLVVGTRDPLYGVLLAGAPFGLLGIGLLQARLEWTPLVILLAAGYIPFSLPTGTGSRLVISLVLAVGLTGLWWFRRALLDKQPILDASPLNGPAAGFSGAVLVSLVWSILFRDPLVFVPASFIVVQTASAMIMIISPLLVLLVGNLARSERILQGMVWLMLSLGPLGLVNGLFALNLPANTAGLAAMWILGLASAQGLFNQQLSRRVRAGLLGLALGWVILGFVINISWMAGWLPGFAAGGVILFLRSKRLLLLVGVVLLVYVLTNEGLIQRWLGDETVTSGDTRLLAWEMNWKFTQEHLLFGMGPAGYAVYYMTYNPTDAMATHSNYIDLLAQTGLVGSAFYLAFFGVILWRGWVVYRRVRGRRNFQEGLAAAALGGVCGCLVIMAFGDWLLPFAYTQTIAGFNYSVYSWLFMGTIPALDWLTAHESEAQGG